MKFEFLKELGTSSDSELLKTAPSWANVTLRPETSSTSAPSVKVPTEEEAKGNPAYCHFKICAK
jgi:formylmethanofuran dehydrogenase subunit D